METNNDVQLNGEVTIWMEKKTKKIYVLVNGVKRYIEAEPCFCNDLFREKFIEI